MALGNVTCGRDLFHPEGEYLIMKKYQDSMEGSVKQHELAETIMQKH